jgi:phage terminase small subunit
MEVQMEMRPIVGSTLSDKHERFCQALMANGGNLHEAYRTVYGQAIAHSTVSVNATRLRARRDVQARMAELTAAAAERALVKPVELIQELREIVNADPMELAHVVSDTCPSCWPDAALGAALDAALADGSEHPDFDAPEPSCKACRGRGVQRVVITPTHELRGPAKRLFKGVRQKSDGSIEVLMHDQDAMRVELHRLLGMHVSRTENLNLNVAVDSSKPSPWATGNMSTDEVLERVLKSRKREPVIDVEVTDAAE